MLEETYLGEYYASITEDDGLPDFNEVVLDFLDQRGVSVEKFGKLYGQAVKDKPYTKMRLYQMIREKSFPTDPKRRWVIAKLLQIPAVYLGVSELDDLLPALKETTQTGKQEESLSLSSVPTSLDVKEYHRALKTYWYQNRTHTAFSVSHDVKIRISILEKEVLYSDSGQKEQLVSLLCGFHMLLANIASDQEEYDHAIFSLNNAYVLAKNHNLHKLQTSILCRRGWVFKERSENYARFYAFDQVTRDLTLASHDFKKALSLKGKMYPGVNGTIILSLGKVEAALAQSLSAFSDAMRKFDQAGSFVGKKNDEETIHFIQLDEARYYLDRADTYLAAPIKVAQYPRDARRELRNALAAQSTPNPQRRLTYNTILQAKSYLIEGEYEETFNKAKEALVQSRAIHSTSNLARIGTLCKELETRGYGKSNIEVTALEIEVIKAQHPGLLH